MRAPGPCPGARSLTETQFGLMMPLRLHLNESPSPPSPRAVAAMQAAAAEAHRYPDNEPAALAAALSASLGVRPGRLVFGNGSSELLLHAAQLVLRSGDEAVVPVPSFPLYAKAIDIQHGRMVGVPTTADGRVDVPAMLAAI